MIYKKNILIGNVNSETQPTGPANVILNLIKQNENEIDFINTYCHKKIDKIKLFFKLMSLIFVKDRVINVHSFGYKVPNIILNISKINKYNKYILTLHGIMSIEANFLNNGSYVEYRNHKEYYDKLEKRIIEQFPNIVCVSNNQKLLLYNRYNREKNVFVIYNGVNMLRRVDYHKKEINSHIKLVMAGGIFNRKGVFELLSFVDYYNKNFDLKVYLDIYGGKESEITLKNFYNEVEKKGINKYIKYFGQIDNSKLLVKFKEAHLCITFSKFDTFNLTILESMSTGTPAIVSKQSGVSELIANRENGYIIDMNNDYILETSKIINDIIYEINQFNEVCKNAYKTAENNQWNRVFCRYKNIINSIYEKDI